jgi:hypothetical protein
MSDHVEALTSNISTSLTRREFTLEAALAILAGCLITVSETACGSSNSPSAPSTPTPTNPADINGVVSANHRHVAIITGAQITAGNAIALDIRGTATHTHTVSVSQSDLTTLKNRQQLVSNSTTDSGHSHTVTFTPA